MSENKSKSGMKAIDRLESNVRSYCRSFPTVFSRSRGEYLYDEAGTRYIDFFAGAGALNYGHNNPHLKEALLAYLIEDGVTHSLDMATRAKIDFLETFEEHILEPRDMRYKTMFPGPTGTNAVEAALKLARKVTGRNKVVAFTNGFHGMTLGSLAVTGNGAKREGAGIPLSHTVRMPFAGYFGGETDTLSQAELLIDDASSGVDAPAAFILETVQAEGGVNVASRSWMQRLAAMARDVGALLIVDDIQVGCGRTGPFFSFEEMGIEPDIICLSKSLSGFGLPLATVLIRPELDQWDPAEHNGTFRGHNPAFVTARAAISHYWKDDKLHSGVEQRAAISSRAMGRMARVYGGEYRGRGLIQGIAFDDASIASRVSQAAFERDLIIETAGPRGEVIKLLPPLTIGIDALEEGLEILEQSFAAVLGDRSHKASSSVESGRRIEGGAA